MDPRTPGTEARPTSTGKRLWAKFNRCQPALCGGRLEMDPRTPGTEARPTTTGTRLWAKWRASGDGSADAGRRGPAYINGEAGYGRSHTWCVYQGNRRICTESQMRPKNATHFRTDDYAKNSRRILLNMAEFCPTYPCGETGSSFFIRGRARDRPAHPGNRDHFSLVISGPSEGKQKSQQRGRPLLASISLRIFVSRSSPRETTLNPLRACRVAGRAYTSHPWIRRSF